MIIRDATQSDFPACARLLRQLWREQPVEQDRGLLGGVFQSLLADSKAKVIVAEESGATVGLLDITFRSTLFHGGPVMIIEDLLIDRAYRRKGAGKALVQAAEQIAVPSWMPSY